MANRCPVDTRGKSEKHHPWTRHIWSIIIAIHNILPDFSIPDCPPPDVAAQTRGPPQPDPSTPSDFNSIKTKCFAPAGPSSLSCPRWPCPPPLTRMLCRYRQYLMPWGMGVSGKDHGQRCEPPEQLLCEYDIYYIYMERNDNFTDLAMYIFLLGICSYWYFCETRTYWMTIEAMSSLWTPRGSIRLNYM